MQSVKVFSAVDSDELETKINEWFTAHPFVDVIDFHAFSRPGFIVPDEYADAIYRPTYTVIVRYHGKPQTAQ